MYRKSKHSFMFSYFSENPAFYEICEKQGTARQATDNIITGGMRIACWIIKATVTHLEFVILSTFRWQQSLRRRASTLLL